MNDWKEGRSHKGQHQRVGFCLEGKENILPIDNPSAAVPLSSPGTHSEWREEPSCVV